MLLTYCYHTGPILWRWWCPASNHFIMTLICMTLKVSSQFIYNFTIYLAHTPMSQPITLTDDRVGDNKDRFH